MQLLSEKRCVLASKEDAFEIQGHTCSLSNDNRMKQQRIGAGCFDYVGMMETRSHGGIEVALVVAMMLIDVLNFIIKLN